MTIFSDIHTYLIISFFMMIVLLYVYGGKQVDDLILTKTNKIRETVENAENRKYQAEHMLKIASDSLADSQERVNDTLYEAQLEADKILESSNDKLKSILDQKEKEYHHAIGKIRSGITTEMQIKIATLVLDRVKIMLEEGAGDDGTLHNKLITNSIEMLKLEKKHN